MSAQDFASAAEALVGAPFRPGGRDPQTGLDCLGLVAAALLACSFRGCVPASRTLRRRGDWQADAVALSAGFVPAPGAIARGDVLLIRCSPIQPHVVVAASDGLFVHAHAGLGKVVLGPADPAWRIAGRWRLPELSEEPLWQP